MAEKTSYLNQLNFDPKLRNSLVAKYLSNPRLVILLVILILIVGISSFLSLPRVLNPNIKIPIVIINTVLPGAGPKDIESLITIPIEDAIGSVQKVTSVTSSSLDSVSSITLQFESGVDPEKARSDVQAAVDTVSGLPTDVQTPQVQKFDFQNQPVWTFILTSKGDQASLMRYALILKDKIKAISTVDKVTANGLDNQEIQITIKPDAISTYGLNPLVLSAAIKSALNSYPAGSISTNNSSLTLTMDPAAVSVEDLRNLRITVGDKSIALSEVATIAERPKPDQLSSLYADHKLTPVKAVTFSVFKTSGTSISKSVEDVKKAIDEEKLIYGDQFTIATVLDTAKEVNKQSDDLIRDFSITIVLIFIALFVFLGARQAIVASLSIPLTFLLTFFIMKITSIDLSFIAFFSLLLALGLLVDDTIVVISATTAYHRTGRFTPLETGLLVWRDFSVVILTTTITTVWAFVPLLLASGIIGEFIKAIPIVVSSTLISSLGVAMLITLPFVIIILKPSIPHRTQIFLKILGLIILIAVFVMLVPKNSLFIIELLLFFALIAATYRYRGILATEIVSRFKKNDANMHIDRTRFTRILDNGVISFEKISSTYKRLIDRILASKSARRNTIVMVVIFSIFSYLLLPLGFVVNEFFPKSDATSLYLNLELPAGTNKTITEREAVVILKDLRKIPEAEYVTADVGQSASGGGFGGGGGGSNTVSFTIVLPELSHRKKTSIDIADQLRQKYAGYTTGTISVVEQSGGPPAGSDLQIKLFGDDLTVLDSYANKIQQYLEKQPGVADVSKSIKPGTSKIVFSPNKDQLSQTGITADQVGLWLRIFASGLTVKNVNFDNEKKDITIRLNSNVQTPEAISGLSIPSQSGPIPISSLGSLKLETNPTLITREGGKRTISVAAAVKKGYALTTINRDLEKFADNQLGLPSGYSWKTGGVNEENQKSVNSILQAMILSFLLIVITMVVQFGSFRKALIVMLVIPLSISGVFIVFALTRTPLSFPALIGVLALFGIVVKNSILIVDKIKQNEEAGIDFTHAISDAAASRLEAIALTSFTAILGLIPITLSDPLWRGLGGAIIAGLSFSGTIMLFFIPVVYYYWFHPKTVEKDGKAGYTPLKEKINFTPFRNIQ